MKVVVNRCWGGFSLNHRGIMAYAKEKGIKVYAWLAEDSLSKDRYATVEDAVAASDKDDWMADCVIMHTTVPQAKYEAAHKADEKKGNYQTSNAMCLSHYDIARNDPALVAVVEKLGPKCHGKLAKLEVREIPDGTEFEIADYDGMETIHEVHRSW